MDKFIRIYEFSEQLFSNIKAAWQVGEIMEGIMAARSLRLSEIAAKMPGQETASYKRIQRFLRDNDPQEALKLLFNEEAEFVIGDPTEIERPHANRTAYVGTLKDGQTKGFWMLSLATPLFYYDAEQKRPLQLLIAPINMLIFLQTSSVCSQSLKLINLRAGFCFLTPSYCSGIIIAWIDRP